MESFENQANLGIERKFQSSNLVAWPPRNDIYSLTFTSQTDHNRILCRVHDSGSSTLLLGANCILRRCSEFSNTLIHHIYPYRLAKTLKSKVENLEFNRSTYENKYQCCRRIRRLMKSPYLRYIHPVDVQLFLNNVQPEVQNSGPRQTSQLERRYTFSTSLHYQHLGRYPSVKTVRRHLS